MFGKAVKVRHCPATVTGMQLGEEKVTAQAGRPDPKFFAEPEVRRPILRTIALKHVSRENVS
jgi:hypothetical protein